MYNEDTITKVILIQLEMVNFVAQKGLPSNRKMTNGMKN